jgi:G3E family GTPase
VINKTDLVTPEELDNVQDDIKSVNSVAEILQTERSRYNFIGYPQHLTDTQVTFFLYRIPLDFVLDIGAYDVKNVDSIARQTNKIEEHGQTHAHQLSHVSIDYARYGVKHL